MLDKIIEKWGGTASLARELGYKTPMTVKFWADGTHPIRDIVVPQLVHLGKSFNAKPYHFRADLYAKTDKGAPYKKVRK